MKKEKTKALVMRIPESWAIKIKEIASSECRTEASVYRQAIKAFLSTANMFPTGIENREER